MSGTSPSSKLAGHEDNEVEVPKSDPKPLTFWQKLRKHLRKWWWLHLIIVICITLLIVLLVLYLGVKNIVQSQFNKATLSVLSEAATDPQPDSFHLQLVTEQDSHTSFRPVIEPFNASLALPGSDTPFLYFTTPSVQTESVFNVTVDQKVFIANVDEFVTYNKAVFYNETVSVQVLGRPRVSLKGLPKYVVTYDRLSSQKGLNSLPGFQVVDLTLLPGGDPVDNATITNTIVVNNPSLITIEMGTITEDLYSSANGTYLGYVSMSNFTLRPGNNCFQARGFMDLNLVSKYVTEDKILPLEIRGNKSVNAAGQELTYYSRTLQSSIIKYDLNLTAAVLPRTEAQCAKLS